MIIVIVEFVKLNLDPKIGGEKMNNLKRERQKRGLTQTDLAYLSRTAQNYISLAENGRFVPTAPMQLKLAKALKWEQEPCKLFDACEESEDKKEGE